MKINIVYESKFGNGKNVVGDLVEILKAKKNEVRLFMFTDTKPDELPPADLYIFHSPTRQFMLPLGVRGFIKRFKPPADKTRYALSTTYMDPRTIALKKIDIFLQKKGMVKVTDDLKIKALDLKGPLEDYKEKLKGFAAKLIN
jgi:flavodoxin